MKNSDDNVITGFRKMSKQRILDMARAHINKTRVPSLNREGNCAYAGSGCNAAPLLVKSARSKLDKLGAWSELVSENKVPANNVEFIGSLQIAHDNAANRYVHDFLNQYNINMQALADRYSLTYKPIV